MGDCQTLQIWLRNLIKYGGMLNIRFVWHRTSNVCRIFGGWKLAERIFENSNEDQKMQILFFARKEFVCPKKNICERRLSDREVFGSIKFKCRREDADFVVNLLSEKEYLWMVDEMRLSDLKRLFWKHQMKIRRCWFFCKKSIFVNVGWMEAVRLAESALRIICRHGI